MSPYLDAILPSAALLCAGQERTIPSSRQQSHYCYATVYRSTHGVSDFEIGISLFDSIDVAYIVLQHDTRQNHLDLIGSKEPTRACMAAVAECEAVWADTDKLVVDRGFECRRSTATGWSVERL